MATVFDAQRESFSANPDDRRTFEALEEHYFLEGDWEALAQLYRERVDAPSIVADVSLQSPLLLRLGQILEERTLDVAGATEVYWRLAKLGGESRPALRQLRGIYEQREQWDMVLQIAEIESQTEMPPYERAAFESELGLYWKEHLQDNEEARRAFERALAADPICPEALEGLAELQIETGEFAPAAQLLETLAERLRGPERAPVWTSLGRLYAQQLGERGRAIECFRNALDDDPFLMSAVEWSLLLETEFENWSAVGDLLERRFDLAAGARHRAAVAVEASQLQLSQLDSPAAARAWINRAIELAGDEPSVLLALADVDRAEGDSEALGETLDTLRAELGSRMPRPLLLESAGLHAGEGRNETALELVRLASEKPGTDDAAFLSLQADLFRTSGAKRELAEILETLTALDGFRDDPRRLDALIELAKLQEEDLGDSAQAASTWQRAFDLAPERDETLQALEQIHQKRNDSVALEATYEKAIAARGPDAAPALRVRLAHLYLDSEDHAADEWAAARRQFENVLDRAPGHPEALAGLRRVAERTEDEALLLRVCDEEAGADASPERIRELAAACIPMLAKAGRTEEALGWANRWNQASPNTLDVLNWKAEFELELGHAEAEIETLGGLEALQTGRARAVTLRRRADRLADAGEESASIADLEASLFDDPNDLETLEIIADYRREHGPHSALASALRAFAEALPTRERSPVLEELAELLHGPLGDLDGAIVVRGRIMDGPDPTPEAGEALEALLETAGRHAELASRLEIRRRTLSDDDAAATALDLRRAGLLLDALGQCEAAAKILRPLTETQPEWSAAHTLLERAYREGDDATGLCELLARRETAENDPAQRAALRMERALLLEQRLNQPLAACDLYEAIAAEAPESDRAAAASERLERLLEGEREWERLRDFCLQRLEHDDSAPQRALRERIAALCRDRLADYDGCAEQLEAIAALEPDPKIWRQLEDLYRNQLDRPSEWLRVVRAEIESGPDPERELLLQVGAARLLLDDDRRPAGHDAGEATAHFERVLALEPGHAEAASALAKVYEASGQFEQTRRILELRLGQMPGNDYAERSALRIRLGRILADRLDEPAAAIEHLEAADERDRLQPEIAESLAGLYEQTERFDALARLAEHMLEPQRAGEASAVWRLRHARSTRRIGESIASAASYRLALEQAPADREIEDELIELYEEQNDFESLAERLRLRAEALPESDAWPVRLRLAEVHADGRRDEVAALAEYERILAEAPNAPAARPALGRALEIAQRLGRDELVSGFLDLGLRQADSARERADLLEQRGLLRAERLEDPEGALTDLGEALSLDPHRSETRKHLRAQLQRLERWPAVLDCLFLEYNAAEGEARVALCETAAELAHAHLSADASLPWRTRLREEEPHNPARIEPVRSIHLGAGRFEAALRTLDEEIALRTSPSAAEADSDTGERIADLQIQRAGLLESKMAAPGRAVLAYQAALEAGPGAETERRILAELDRLYSALDRPLDRAQILERRTAGLGGLEGVELRTALAALYNTELAQPERAVAPLLRNIESLRPDPVAEMSQLSALDRALRGRGESEAWSRMAERALELIRTHEEVRSNATPDDVAYLQEELARVCDEDLGQPLRALEHLRSVNGDAGDPEMRDQRLRQLLRRTDRPAELARQIEKELARPGSDRPALDRDRDALELALLREERLQDLRGALEAYRLISADSELALEAIRGFRRCAERLRDWPTLAEALSLESEQSEGLSRFERAAAARALGELAQQRLGDPERAASAFELALSLEPNHVDAVRTLTEIRAGSGDPDSVRTLYRRELELLGERPAEQSRAREVWLALAASLDTNPGSEREALDAFQAAGQIAQLSPEQELRTARLHDLLGEADRFCEVFASWCDRDDSPASVREHLELAERLSDRERDNDALHRAARACEIAPASAEAWALRARLERSAGRRTEAGQAFLAAAEHADPKSASAFCIEASLCLEQDSLADACDALTRASELDPSSMVAFVALTRGAAALGDDERTWRAADRALELTEFSEMADETRREIGLLGGQAAARCEERGAARRLFAGVLVAAPEDVEALEAIAHSDFEAGDFHTARLHLETRVELEEEDPRRGEHLAMIGRGLEADGLLDAAWARYDAALEAEPDHGPAYAGLVRVHERAGRLAQAMEVLEAWSEHGETKQERAAAALRAAEHGLEVEEHASAQRLLERATTLDPNEPRAWMLLAEQIDENGSESEARAVCEAALVALSPSPEAAAIALRSARLAERNGDPILARERFGQARSWDASCVAGALGETRLIRSTGDWAGAEAVLAAFLAAHPAPQSEALAPVYLERGRLLSGPLANVEGAIEAYGQALELQPDLNAARTALAGLLVHSEERWGDALELGRAALANDPTHGPSLRALGELAEKRGANEIANAVQTVLDALGHTPRPDQATSSGRIPFATHAAPPMAEIASERLRRIAHLLREDASNVLGEIEVPTLDVDDSEVAEVVGEILRVEGELAAPGIGLLQPSERRDFFSAAAGLLLDPGGNGGHPRYREALDRALGRWSRRKLRRIVEETSLEAIEAFDHESWGDELRAMAAASLLDRGGRSLTVVLMALLVLDDPERDARVLAAGHLETLIADTGSANKLLARLTSLFCDRLGRGQ